MEDEHRPRAVTWTDEENKLLFDAVKRHGKSWKAVAADVPNRTENMCRKHYYNYYGHLMGTSQKVTKPWTVEEDKLLVEAMQREPDAIDGKKSNGYWDRISTHVPDRSALQCSKRFNKYVRPNWEITVAEAKTPASPTAPKASNLSLSRAPSSSFARAASPASSVGGGSLFSPIYGSRKGKPAATKCLAPAGRRPTSVAATAAAATTTTTTMMMKKNARTNRSDSDNDVDGSTLQAEVTRLRERNQSLKTKKTELKTALKAALYDVDKSDKKINQLTAEAAAAKKETAKWINVSKIKDTTIESFAEKVTDVVEDSQKEIQQLKDQVGDLLATVGRLKSEKKELVTSSKNEKHENQKLRNENRQLREKLSGLKKENELSSDRKVNSSSNARTNTHNGIDAPSSSKRRKLG